jgi:hypothetical protein
MIEIMSEARPSPKGLFSTARRVAVTRHAVLFHRDFDDLTYRGNRGQS